MELINYLPIDIRDNIICIIKTGSSLFCTNCKDVDYIIVTQTNPSVPCFYIRELNIDTFIISLNTMRDRIMNDSYRYKLTYTLAQVYPENVVYGTMPDLKMDLTKPAYLQKILKIEQNYARNNYRLNNKSMVWGLVLHYFIQNNSFTLTEEQQLLIQRTHDYEISLDEMLAIKKLILE